MTQVEQHPKCMDYTILQGKPFGKCCKTDVMNCQRWRICKFHFVILYFSCNEKIQALEVTQYPVLESILARHRCMYAA